MSYKIKNWNCDGSKCTDPNGATRVYPLGGGGNLILCLSCFANENKYRFHRGRETGHPENFPQVSWSDAKPYPESDQ
jgi:hypothetical protein